MKDMLQNVENWYLICRAAVEAVSEECLIDWKLLWRDTLRKWVSGKGRVVLTGDAAHPHLPTSGIGGVQAIEVHWWQFWTHLETRQTGKQSGRILPS